MNQRIIPFTRKGIDELKSKLQTLESQRPQAVKTLSRAREMGDLSENGLYKAAKQELIDIDRQIRYLGHLIRSAKISEPNSKEFIQIGHKVIIKTDDEVKEFFLVGEYEANPKENKISNKSPIGFALMGSKVGEEISIKTPKAILKYKIVSIE